MRVSMVLFTVFMVACEGDIEGVITEDATAPATNGEQPGAETGDDDADSSDDGLDDASDDDCVLVADEYSIVATTTPLQAAMLEARSAMGGQSRSLHPPAF